MGSVPRNYSHPEKGLFSFREGREPASAGSKCSPSLCPSQSPCPSLSPQHKREHSSAETIQMIQRLQLWASGDWQLHHNNVPAHASCLMQRFLVKRQITQVTQPPYSPDLVLCDFWLFPKLKSSLKGKRFQIINEIQENTTGQLMATGRTV